jgi:WD40 repeat protein
VGPGEREKAAKKPLDFWGDLALPDGNRAVSASEDETLKVWDLKRGEELCTLSGHRWRVTSVAVTPDGNRAVSASDDQTLKVWDLDRGKKLRTLKGRDWGVTSVVLTPDGTRAVSASWNVLKVWDLETGKKLRTLKGHVDDVTSLAVTPDGTRAVSASRDQTLKSWDLGRGEELRTSSSISGEIRLFLRLTSRREPSLITMRGHRGDVTSVAVTPDGTRSVSTSSDQTLKVWDLVAGETLATFYADAVLLCVDVLPDGVTFFAGDQLGRVHLLEFQTPNR